MSGFKDFWKNVWNNTLGRLGNLVSGSYLDSLMNKWTGAGLSGAEKESNAFTAQEAQKERDWSQMMRQTTYQDQVSSMQAAGLNPALMYGSGAGGFTAPSGASATSVAPSAPMSMSELMEMVSLKKNLAKIGAETENIQSQTAVNKAEEQRIVTDTQKIGAETLKLNADTELVNLQVKYYSQLTEAQIRKINAEVDKLVAEVPYLQAMTSAANADAALKNSQKILVDKESEIYNERISAEIRKLNADSSVAEWQAAINEYREWYMHNLGTDVPASGWATFLAHIGNVGDKTLGEVLRKFSEALKDALKGSFKDAIHIENKNETKNEQPIQMRVQ